MKQAVMTKAEIQQMRSRIDEGIRLTRIRLLERAKREGRELIVVRDGKVVSISASEL
ncbi:MAG: hypothetical protein IKR18_05045 [Bacteroidaceae bacterium]|nr:hypothetical protein [Bacteroidaceae bacterium]